MVADDELKIRREYFALQHNAPLQDGLRVATSRIPNAGKGLFAAKPFQKGEVVCEYMGLVYLSTQVRHQPDKRYLMRLGDGVFVDALLCEQYLARFINDCRDDLRHNVTFVKKPLLQKALVVALVDLAPGDELYADYGVWYWLGYNITHPNSPVQKQKKKNHQSIIHGIPVVER